MTCSMETISSDAVFLIILIWDCIHSSFLWHIHTKCCIEYCYVRLARHSLLTSLNTDQVSRVMEWSKVEAVTYDFLHILCNQCSITVYSTCMQYTMSDCCDLICALDHTMLRILQCIDYQFDSYAMIRHWLLCHKFVFSCRLVGQDRTFCSDSLTDAFCKNAFVLHIDQLIF